MNDSNDRAGVRAASIRPAHPRLALYRGLWIAWSLVNLVAFAGALTLPLIELRQLYVFQNQVVLIDVPWTLARNHELLLAAVVFVFGIIVPAAKAVAACGAFAAPRLMDWLGRLAPLSFFDVFMIALLIFVAKGAIGTSVATGIGLYPLIFFAVSTKCIDLVLRPKLTAAIAR